MNICYHQKEGKRLNLGKESNEAASFFSSWDLLSFFVAPTPFLPLKSEDDVQKERKRDRMRKHKRDDGIRNEGNKEDTKKEGNKPRKGHRIGA